MPRKNRDVDEAKIGSIFLGKDTKGFFQPIIDDIKKNYGMTNWLKDKLAEYYSENI